MLVAILRTTISPYLFFWRAGEEVEEFQQVAPVIADSIFRRPF
jgi:hypothetical protein